MTAQEIKSLPKEFNFKSNINPGLIYHAVEREHDYVITTDDCEWIYDKHELRHHLLNNDFVVIEENDAKPKPNPIDLTPIDNALMFIIEMDNIYAIDEQLDCIEALKKLRNKLKDKENAK